MRQFVLIFILVSNTCLYAQIKEDLSVVIVSPFVGPQVDKAEKLRYQLFLDYPARNFDYAIILADSKKQFFLHVHLLEGEMLIAQLSEPRLHEIRKKIEKRATKRNHMRRGDEWVFEHHDGTRSQGELIMQTDSSFVIHTAEGKLDISKDELIALEPASALKPVYFIRNAENNSTNLLSSNAIPLNKGEGYFLNQMLVLNSLTYGLTDQLSIGAGLELISTLQGTPFFIVQLKYATQLKDKLFVGIHGYGGFAPASSFPWYGFIGQGVVGFGSNRNNISIGLGYAHADGESGHIPVVSLSAKTQLGGKLALITENWLIPETESTYIPVFSGGLRILGKRTNFDIGYLGMSYILVPYLAMGISF